MSDSPKSHRRKSLSNQQWERLRPIITSLYIRQELQLKDVAQIIRRDYGFSATEQMYKKKFVKWKLRKNYGRQQKEALASLLVKESNVKPVLSENVRRFMRRQGHNLSHLRFVQSLTSQDPPNACNNPCKQPGVGSPSINSTYCQSPAPPIFACCRDQRVESVLHTTKGFCDWTFTNKSSTANYHYTEELGAVFLRLQYARRLMHSKNQLRGFLLLHQACSEVQALLEQRNLRFLVDLLRYFSHTGWYDILTARNAVFTYFINMAILVAGPNHALVTILRHLMTADTLAKAGPGMLDLILKASQAHVRKWEDRFWLQMEIAECYIALGELEEAEAICWKNLLELQLQKKTSLVSNQMMQSPVRNLACICYQRGLWDSAEQLWLDVHRQDLAIHGDELEGTTETITCAHLGALYDGKHDYITSAQFHRMALESAFRTWGDTIVDLFEYYEALEDSLVNAGAIEEVVQLHIEYGPRIRAWDGRQINLVPGFQASSESLLLVSSPLGRKRCDFDAGQHRHVAY